MNVSSVNSMESSLAAAATAMQSTKIPREIGYSVLKQIMDSQAAQAQALVQMIDNGPTPTLDGTGQVVNIGA